MIKQLDGPLQRYVAARDRILSAGPEQVMPGAGDQVVVTAEIALPGAPEGMQSHIEPGTSIHRTEQQGDVVVLHHAPCPTFTRYTDDEVMVVQPGNVLGTAQHWVRNEYDYGGTQRVDMHSGAILAETGKPYVNPEAHYREYLEEE